MYMKNLHNFQFNYNEHNYMLSTIAFQLTNA